MHSLHPCVVSYCNEFIFVFWRTLWSARPPTQFAVATQWLYFNNITLMSTDVVRYCIEFQILVLCLCKTLCGHQHSGGAPVQWLHSVSHIFSASCAKSLAATYLTTRS